MSLLPRLSLRPWSPEMFGSGSRRATEQPSSCSRPAETPTLSGTQTLSINGFIVQGEILRTITVNFDCTGSSVIDVTNTPFPRTAHLDVVWVNSSTEFLAIFAERLRRACSESVTHRASNSRLPSR